MSLHLLQSNSNEYLTLNAESQHKRDREALIYTEDISKNISQERGFKANKPQGMQHSDLFKAEYVFTVDSEGEDEGTTRKGAQTPPMEMGTIAPRPKFLGISSSLVSDIEYPQSHGVELQAPLHSLIPHGTTPQQKSGQVSFSYCHRKSKCLHKSCSGLSAKM